MSEFQRVPSDGVDEVPTPETSTTAATLRAEEHECGLHDTEPDDASWECYPSLGGLYGFP